MISSLSFVTKDFLQGLPTTSRRFIRRVENSLAMYSRRTFASKTSALSLNAKKRKGKKITMVTAYDFPSAAHVARAGIDMILVGDSVAMVELGHETTQNVSIDNMIHHCQAVKRGLELAGSGSMLVGDMPFGTYEYEDTDIALKNAYRFVKEAGCDAVKLEGGSVHRANTAKNIVEGGVAVMGHVGLTPQAISVIGGFRAQGRTAVRARQLLDDALRLQDAGCFSIVLECVPANVATAITETLEVPTIGIGAGGRTSGQVLVFHDMLGMLSHPHHQQFVPKFCKKYAQVGHAIQEGLSQFKDDVESGVFPGEEYSPYVMSDGEKEAFDALLESDAEERRIKHDVVATKLTEADEFVALNLYGTNKNDRKTE
eukprot:CAMPEP_0116117704 /NCGR_PEP_ID=MMETSP0329-20121206/1712_1 /TAXON_ID=697910 /ORGANISM="Pseudo-nitzschia arenysensis, Strain B593" /LENGTH=370 /DNA_ID=CAMNT_0003611281 /DNA_START=118 /DNA_END=1230 /DNA_ORIENTATION=+